MNGRTLETAGSGGDFNLPSQKPHISVQHPREECRIRAGAYHPKSRRLSVWAAFICVPCECNGVERHNPGISLSDRPPVHCYYFTLCDIFATVWVRCHCIPNSIENSISIHTLSIVFLWFLFVCEKRMLMGGLGPQKLGAERYRKTGNK